MDPRVIVALATDSPWSSWARPDIKHCEANLSGWIAAPANTWSNLAYLAAALWLRRRKDPAGRSLAWIVAAIGLTSALFHASYTFCFQVLDYGGMFLYSAWIISSCLRRAGLLEKTAAAGFHAGLAVTSVAAVVEFHSLGWKVQPLFGGQALAALGFEAWLWASGRDAASRKPLLAAAGLAALGFVFWNLDHADWFCRPGDHLLQGHALWHLLTAASFIPAYRYFRQFDPASA